MSQTNQNPAPRKEPGVIRTALVWLLRVTLRDWPLKLLSLAIALALWTGLITQDPTLTRDRAFRNVTVSVNNQDALRRSGYIVTSDIGALLQNVTVTAAVPQMKYQEATADRYNIRVDLSRLEHRAGEQTLSILTTGGGTYGSVTSISPASITVTVEEYVTRSYIPVNVVKTGELPQGFYAREPAYDPAWITVSGPRSLVEQIRKAEVTLDMRELPTWEGESTSALPFVLLDKDGKPVSSDLLEVTRESVARDSVNVSVTLFSMREADVLNERLYSGKPAAGYVVTDVYVTPSTVTLAGKNSVINTIDLVQPQTRLDIDGATESVTGDVRLTVPVNVEYMSATEVTVTVVIRPEKEASWQQVPVTVAGLPDGWTAALSHETAMVRVTGEKAWVDGLAAVQLSLICDVSGLAEGTHSIPPRCAIDDSESREFLLETEPPMIEVTLTAPAAE